MTLWELLVLAVGLSMDAFAVSLCTGLTMQKVTWKKALIVGLYFGVFQAAMPLVGFLVGTQFTDLIAGFDHWVAFALLAFIGGKMFWESFKKDDDDCEGEASLGPRRMLPLALATSIDALAVGVTFAFLNVRVVPAVSFIGATTLILSMTGVKLGQTAGKKYQTRAERLGGVILVLMGVKILLEHLGIINF